MSHNSRLIVIVVFMMRLFCFRWIRNWLGVVAVNVTVNSNQKSLTEQNLPRDLATLTNLCTLAVLVKIFIHDLVEAFYGSRYSNNTVMVDGRGPFTIHA